MYLQEMKINGFMGGRPMSVGTPGPCLLKFDSDNKTPITTETVINSFMIHCDCLYLACNTSGE